MTRARSLACVRPRLRRVPGRRVTNEEEAEGRGKAECLGFCCVVPRQRGGPGTKGSAPVRARLLLPQGGRRRAGDRGGPVSGGHENSASASPQVLPVPTDVEFTEHRAFAHARPESHEGRPLKTRRRASRGYGTGRVVGMKAD